jgi:4,5-dihydroxyphthalate decarboxylase
MAVRVSLACGASDRTLPMILGDVPPAGIDLTFLRMYPEEFFWRMTRHAEFDAAEMSLSSYVLRCSRGDDAVMAIPVFTSREFRHSCMWVRADADIHEPRDLKGKRMGAAEYELTANVWIRGLLSDDFGVAPADMHWFIGGLYQPGRVEKLAVTIPGVEIQSIGPAQTLSQMLDDGELDAIMGPRPPSGFPGQRVRRLFEDFRSVEIEYFRRTRVFPSCTR